MPILQTWRWGAALRKKDENSQFRSIDFANQNLPGVYCVWPIIEKAALSVFFGLRKFEKWTHWSQVEVITDQNPLKFLTETTIRSPKVTRWALVLQCCNLSISHRPHLNADAICRQEVTTPTDSIK